jgi:predicted phosphodiesterase
MIEMAQKSNLRCPACNKEDLTYNRTTTRSVQYRCNNDNCKTKYFSIPILSNDEQDAVVKLAKAKQKQMDNNRIERKLFREHARVDNAIGQFEKDIANLLKNHAFHDLPVHKIDKVSGAGILQLSDMHLNELVDLPANKFNFAVGSQRLYKYVQRAKKFFEAFNVQEVLIALTGDLLNSDRRLDELLNQSANRSRATFIAVDLIQSIIRDMGQSFNIHITSVSGNESRVKDEIGYSEKMITDNYDFTIYEMLRKLFKDQPVKFIKTNHVEQPVRIGDKTVLLVHGEHYKGDVEKKVIQTCGKWASRGTIIDFVIFGHLHYARIGDHFGRSASLVGMNDYSDKALQLITKASQNIHIIEPDGSLHSVKVDLQDVAEDAPGYEYDKEMAEEAYNPKSKSKLHQKQTIYQIVI